MDQDSSAATAIIRKQLQFFVKKKAGCLFAAAAAKHPVKYGWVHQLADVDPDVIARAIEGAIADTKVSTLSLLFPEVRTPQDLVGLVRSLEECPRVVRERAEEFEGTVCLGYRARVGEFLSYITGFGEFPFLPSTRRAPFVELTMRVKPRPDYEFVFKEAPPGVLHLADLDMRGMRRERLRKLWDKSFLHTEEVLGMKPDVRSAARTTFSIPGWLLATP